MLNPIGVPSRMNVGQILEAILGYAGQKMGAELGKQLNEQGTAAVKPLLERCYGKDLIAEYERNYGHAEGLLELAEKSHKQGVFFKSPCVSMVQTLNAIFSRCF